MKLLALNTVGLLVIASSCLAQDDMTKESMAAGVRASLEAYDVVRLSGDMAPTTFKTQLGETTSSLESKLVFDGLRFTAPEKLDGRDFIWYFNAPNHWGNWFIIPVEGDFNGGFRNWLNGDKLYRELDTQGEKDRLRVLQTLDASYFKPGQDYILWFRKVGDGPPAELRGVLGFASKSQDSEDWDHAKIEKALKLKPAAAADQGRELGSRGAKIMLDKEFFEPKEAEDRIDQVFFDMRQTQQLRGGFFVTMEISCPPCKRKPFFVSIRQKHGEPDLTITSEETARVRKHAGGDEPQDKNVVVHYYDYFGFEVAVDDPKERVLRVTTTASNFASVRAPDDSPFFGRVPMKNLIVFRDKNREVGRMYYFLEAGKEPLGIQTPPAGTYRSGNERLEQQGDGHWLWQTTRAGRIVRTIPMENNRMHGRAEGFFDSGNPSFVANYNDGRLDGEVVEYSEDGKVTRKQAYRNGKPERTGDDAKRNQE